MSGERLIPEEIKSLGEYLIYLKGIFTYQYCSQLVDSGACCLDLGCGDGYGTKIMSDRFSQVVAIDISQKLHSS